MGFVAKYSNVFFFSDVELLRLFEKDKGKCKLKLTLWQSSVRFVNKSITAFMASLGPKMRSIPAAV